MIAFNGCVAEEINGVRLRRGDGQLRRRFSCEDRRRLLGPYEAELNAFIRLFGRRRAPYIYQLQEDGQRKDWKTVNHRLSDDYIVRHLLADRIPGGNILWVGTGSWETTKHVLVDVDHNGDDKEFQTRCRKVETALYRLGIPEEAWLRIPTPSGGLHYYFFFYEQVLVSQLRWPFEAVRLPHIQGQHEIYPNGDRRTRLPFGHVPGMDHDSEKWVDFIRQYQSGEFPRVNWQRCFKRADAYMDRRTVAARARQTASKVAAALEAKKHSHKKSLTTATRTAIGVPKRDRGRLGRYIELVSQPITTLNQAAELLALGIMLEGTRVEATKRVAIHLVFGRRMTEAEAAEILVKWVYRTGQNTSRDVRADATNGRRTVEEQTRQIVSWCVRQRESCSADRRHIGSRKLYSPDELDAIVASVVELPGRLQRIQARFVLKLLNLAKTHGYFKQGAWQARPAVKEVLRKWKGCGCSGMRYKERLTAAYDAGIVSIVKGPWHNHCGKGRATTYAVHVPVPWTEEELDFDYGAAESYIDARLARARSNTIKNLNNHTESDTDKRIVLPKGEKDRWASELREESVADGNDPPVKSVGGRGEGQPTAATALAESGHECSGDINEHPREEHQHPASADGPLVQSEGRCLRAGPDAPAVHDPTVHPESTPPSDPGEHTDAHQPIHSEQSTDEGRQYSKSSRGSLASSPQKRNPVSDALENLRAHANRAGPGPETFGYRQDFAAVAQAVRTGKGPKSLEDFLVADDDQLGFREKELRAYLKLETHAVLQPT